MNQKRTPLFLLVLLVFLHIRIIKSKSWGEISFNEQVFYSERNNTECNSFHVGTFDVFILAPVVPRMVTVIIPAR